MRASCNCHVAASVPVHNRVLLGVAGCGTMLAVNTGSLLPQLVEWQAGVLALLSASGMILIVTQQNAIRIATSNSLYHIEATSARRSFLRRLLVGTGLFVASATSIGKVSASEPCDCRCNKTIIDMINYDCSACDDFCARCPPNPCTLIVEIRYQLHCCENTTRKCGTSKEYKALKCC
jgi:hypothetical protein